MFKLLVVFHKKSNILIKLSFKLFSITILSIFNVNIGNIKNFFYDL